MLMYMSLISRLAYIMRLQVEDRSLPFLEQERKRRLMWAIYVLDSLYSSGRLEFTSCPTELIQIQLPCKETLFAMDVSVTTERLRPPLDTSNKSNLGLMAYCIRVLDFRDRVNR